jgi:hypothetical protein
MGVYSERISYDGENADGGPTLFFVEREAGAIFFENFRVVIFSESLDHDPIFFVNLQLLSHTVLKIFNSRCDHF